MNAHVDTHKIVKRLLNAGFSDNQAETVADVMREASETQNAQLATKTDLAETKVDLIKWLVATGIAQVALILTIMKLFAH